MGSPVEDETGIPVGIRNPGVSGHGGGDVPDCFIDGGSFARGFMPERVNLLQHAVNFPFILRRPVKAGQDDGDAFSPADHTAVLCPAVAGTYRAEGNRIYFEKDGSSVPAAELLREISALALSSDGWRLYAACRDAGCIYAMTVLPDGGLAGRYKHAALHTYTDFAFPGAADLCTDGHDRIFAAAECGVQCVRPFGLIDVIAPLPQNAVPEALCIVTRADGMYLTVRTADAVWERRLAPPDPNLRENEPKPASYYD